MALGDPLSLKPRFALVTALIFGAAYYLVGVLASAVGVFLLDWWEPKWGSRLGSWMMDVTTFLPLFACASTLGGLIAILLTWRRLSRCSMDSLARRAVVAGAVTAAVAFVLAYVRQFMARGAADWVRAAAQAWVALGAVVVWLVLALTISKRPSPKRAA
jgi:hypothetical protein